MKIYSFLTSPRVTLSSFFPGVSGRGLVTCLSRSSVLVLCPCSNDCTNAVFSIPCLKPWGLIDLGRTGV